jgi:hypothetical protein
MLAGGSRSPFILRATDFVVKGGATLSIQANLPFEFVLKRDSQTDLSMTRVRPITAGGGPWPGAIP